ncbi:hypothetical protein MHYP_G00041820 [Metynnis hypsauchen]
MDSPVLRVIFDHRIEKLTLSSGIPEALEELIVAVKQMLAITNDISLQYLDSDFDDFFTLHSTAQIKHKSTIKVVTVAPVVLTLYPHNESLSTSDIIEPSLVPHPSSSTTAEEFSDSSESSASTLILSSSSSPERKPWPTEFMIPRFSVETEMVLERASDAYRKDGTLLTNPSIRSDILEKLAQSIYTYTAYPSALQILSVAEALVKAHPCLKDRGSFSGLYAWQTSIKYKMGNFRTKLRGFGIPDVTCNALQHKHPNDRKSAKNVKKPRRAEVNYLPPYPVGEDEQSLEKEREELISESKKKNNEKVIKEKMRKTFAHRRHEIVNRCPSVQDFRDRWPALFDPSQISAEFQRITTVHLEPKFMSTLDLYTPKLLTLFRTRGGALGVRLKKQMEQLKESQCSIENTRGVVIRCLMEYLGEHGGGLIKEFNASNLDSQLKMHEPSDPEGLEVDQLLMAVVVMRNMGASADDSPKDIGIVIERVQVVTGLKDIATACAVLFGLTYVLNLSYPSQLKHTFECVFCIYYRAKGRYTEPPPGGAAFKRETPRRKCCVFASGMASIVLPVPCNHLRNTTAVECYDTGFEVSKSASAHMTGAADSSL